MNPDTFPTTDHLEGLWQQYNKTIGNRVHGIIMPTHVLPPRVPGKSGPSAYDELMALTGLDNVKTAVTRELSYHRIMERRRNLGCKVPQRLLHMLLTGNPGTGKTTCARLIGRIYKEAGLLTSGHMIETSRSGLVGQYIGQSEKIASEKIQAARGGVLFIDEIYALSETGGANYGNRDFGVKVIDTLMPVLADESSNIMVIGAGYTPEMKRFLKANSGIASRFPIVLEFKDFTLEELMTIANDYLTRYDFRMTPTAEEKLKQLLSETSSIEDSGNARLVKTLINNYIIPNLCMRLDRNGCNCNDHERLSLIIPADIPELSEVVPLHAQERTRIGFQTRSPLKHT